MFLELNFFIVSKHYNTITTNITITVHNNITIKIY